MKQYILTYEGKIKAVESLTQERYIMASHKKRHLRKRLKWYLRNGIRFIIKGDVK